MSRRTARAAMAATLLATNAAAQDFGGVPDGPPLQRDIEWTLGLGVVRQPVYLGADESRTRALPVFGVRSRAGWFAGVGGVGWRFGPEGGPWSGGVRLGWDPGRDESDSPALRGLGDVPLRPELGAFGRWRLLPGLNVTAGWRYGSGQERNGQLVDLGLRGTLPLAANWRLVGGVGVTGANAASMQSLFGITAEQAARSGYGVYSPAAGWRDTTLDLGLAWQAAPDLNAVFGLQQRRLRGDAASSPLVREPNATRANLMLMWRL